MKLANIIERLRIMGDYCLELVVSQAVIYQIEKNSEHTTSLLTVFLKL